MNNSLAPLASSRPRPLPLTPLGRDAAPLAQAGLRALWAALRGSAPRARFAIRLGVEGWGLGGCRVASCPQCVRRQKTRASVSFGDALPSTAGQPASIARWRRSTSEWLGLQPISPTAHLGPRPLFDSLGMAAVAGRGRGPHPRRPAGVREIFYIIFPFCTIENKKSPPGPHRCDGARGARLWKRATLAARCAVPWVPAAPRRAGGGLIQGLISRPARHGRGCARWR